MSSTVVPWASDPSALAVLQPRRQRSKLTVIAMMVLGLALLVVGGLLLVAGEPLPLLVSTAGRRRLVPAAGLVLLLAGSVGARAGPLPLGRPGLGRQRGRLDRGRLPVRDRGLHPVRVLGGRGDRAAERGVRQGTVPGARRVHFDEPSCTAWWTGSSTPGWPASASRSPRTFCTTPARSSTAVRRSWPRRVIVRGIFSPFAHPVVHIGDRHRDRRRGHCSVQGGSGAGPPAGLPRGGAAARELERQHDGRRGSRVPRRLPGDHAPGAGRAHRLGGAAPGRRKACSCSGPSATALVAAG